jgi:F-type H+-transporting ATPase subunit delta
MSTDIAAGRYARAAFELAVADGGIPEWSFAIETLGALTSDKRFVYALSQVDDARFQSIIRQVLPDATQLQLNLFRLLHRKRRLALGPSIASRFIALAEVHDGVVRADIRTAVELSVAEQASLVERLSASVGKRVQPQFTVDETLIGGMTIQIGDQKLDGSVKTRFRDLHRTLTVST